MEKIMYKYYGFNNQEITFAIPNNLKELKALVWDGFCVCNLEEADFESFYEDCEWYEENYTQEELIELFENDKDSVSTYNISEALQKYEFYTQEITQKEISTIINL